MAVKRPFLPPWRPCVTAVEGAEQGVFCMLQNPAGAALH